MSGADSSAETFIAAILGPKGQPIGVGVLLGRHEVVTCAHVVNAALGRDLAAQDRPEHRVQLTFPLAGPDGQSTPIRAEVRKWSPPGSGADLAGLVFVGDVEGMGIHPGSLETDAGHDRSVRLFGYPSKPRRPRGVWADAVVRGRVVDGLQLDMRLGSAHRAQPGFSGAPVIDNSGRGGLPRVLGVLVSAPLGDSGERDSYAIPAERILAVWPEASFARGSDTSDIEGKRHHSDHLTVLHVSDTRFGAAQRDEVLAPDEIQDALFGALHDDINALAGDHELAPDLVVATGNLAQSGRPSEFAQSFRFLDALSLAIAVPHRHFAIVPGPHDVNRSACRAYFDVQSANERDPVEPYFPKWAQYELEFARFYEGVDGVRFPPDEPWSLFDMPDLQVAVAGLNSTWPDSHQAGDQYGLATGRQLAWFADRLRPRRDDGWFRLAVLHHAVRPGAPSDDRAVLRDSTAFDAGLGGPGLANLVLAGRTVGEHAHRLPSGLLAVAPGSGSARSPYRYQLLRLTPTSVGRRVRQFGLDLRRWTDAPDAAGDEESIEYAPVATSAAFPQAVTQSEPASRSAAATAPSESLIVPRQRRPYEDTLFATVAEATRIARPDAILDERPQSGYLRVILKTPDYSGVDMYVVGVVDGRISKAAVERFIDDVHRQFSARNPTAQSELVYEGERASEHLIEWARRQNIRLQSVIEYQGLIDLRGLVAEQTQRLNNAPDYAPERYIPQRYRLLLGDRADGVKTDLAARVAKMLAAKESQLVMVLGDFGRGKTALLRQLARTIPDDLPHLQPILVELRSLEKRPQLAELVSNYLVNQQVDGVSMRKLQYMIASGKVALLLDGFDELEQRVGYDGAAEYLEKLIGSVTGNAKLVLTSRTQHFQSNDQVRTAFGDRVAGLPSSQILLLEDFDTDQIKIFLKNLNPDQPDEAEERFRLLASVHDLLGLAQNPRMLSSIATIESRRLDEIRLRHNRISAAEIYRELITAWLSNQSLRTDMGGEPSALGDPTADADADAEERLRACMELAKQLWTSGQPAIPVADLVGVADHLAELLKHNYDRGQAAHSLGTGSLLVRGANASFTFLHDSVLDWLVASDAAAAVQRDEEPVGLSSGRYSPLMIDFFIDLAGPAAAEQWARRTLDDKSADGVARLNATTITMQLSKRHAIDDGSTTEDALEYVNVDMRELDLTGRDLRHYNLSAATLRGMRLVGVQLADADLHEADFSGARMVGGSLRGADLTNSKWDDASLLGVEIDQPESGRPRELRQAAIAKADKHTVQIPAGGAVSSVAISEDGRLLAIARVNVVEIADRSTGRTLRILSGRSGLVRSVALSPSGEYVAIASDDHAAQIWDVVNGQAPVEFVGHTDAVTSVVFSRDGRKVATGSLDRTARVWDAGTGQELARLDGHEMPVTGVAFSPTGAELATSSYDPTVRVWDIESQLTTRFLVGHTAQVTAVRYAPDGRQLATASVDKTVRIWNARNGRSTATLFEPDTVTDVMFDRTGGRVVTASHDKNARLWDIAGRHIQTTFSGHVGVVNTVRVTPDGLSVITGAEDYTVRVWEINTGNAQSVIVGPTDSLASVAFTPDGRRLMTTSTDSAARIWDVATGQLMESVIAHLPNAVTAAFSPDGTRMATGSDNRVARIWHRDQMVARFGDHDGPVSSVQFSPDGALLATVSNHNIATLWTIRNKRKHRTMAHEGSITALAFSPDSRYLAVACDDRSIQIWDVDKHERTRVIQHSGFLAAIAFSPDGRRLAAASYDHTAQIWDLSSGRTHTSLVGHGGPVTAVAFAANGHRVATGSYDRTARVWDAGTGRQITVLVGHTSLVTAVAFAPTLGMLATTSYDRTTRLWDLREKVEIAALLGFGVNDYAVFQRGGSYKVKGDARDEFWWAIKLCRFEPGELDEYVDDLHLLTAGIPLLPKPGDPGHPRPKTR